jgi:aspartyl-tRNA synthetase
LESASSAQQELRLLQSATTQQFQDAEAHYKNLIEMEKAAAKAQLTRANTIAGDLERSKKLLEDTLGLLQQVKEEKLLLVAKLREQERGESDRMNNAFKELHKKIDETTGEREAAMLMLIAKDREIACFKKDIESLRNQVQPHPCIPHCFAFATSLEFFVS